jgi:hypothetical protein
MKEEVGARRNTVCVLRQEKAARIQNLSSQPPMLLGVDQVKPMG